MVYHKYNTNLLDVNIIGDKLDLRLGDQVADFGCGRSGAFSFWAAGLVGDKGSVYALDIIKEFLEQIKREAHELNFTNIKTIWSDLENYSPKILDTVELDKILIINVLHQSQNPDAILNEAKRLLKTGGKILVVDWLKIATPFGPETRVDRSSIKDYAESIGLQTQGEFMPGRYHFGLLLKK